jgi:metal-sulfur cluster biosynthetic enzyme
MGDKRIVTRISEEEVRQALAEVMHPAIDRTLVELGMIKNMTIRNDKVVLTLSLPFPNIPIKKHLVNIVQEAVMKLGVEVKVEIGQMNQKERESFLTMEQKSWKGSI